MMATSNTQFVYGQHRIDPDQTIASLLDQIPSALPFLIKLGFTPLAEPLTREQFAPHRTIRQAAETLPISLDRLLTDLDRLASDCKPASLP